MREKLEKQMKEKLEKEISEKVESRKQRVEIKELKNKNKKIKNLTTNQVTNNSEKIIIKH